MPPGILLPQPVRLALSRLNNAGFEAFIVGGCVRDSLLGLAPHDWDIATSAAPEQIAAVFSSFRCVFTGARHGTVTVLVPPLALEITTFRKDALYTDHRHPSSVMFTTSLKHDLCRRDFTVNAMAYHPQTGLLDPFGGQQDLNAQLIRCVGKPNERLDEDALRILRALRFSAQLGFAIEEATLQAVLQKATLLSFVSNERKTGEISRLLVCKSLQAAMPPCQSVFAAWWPLLGKMPTCQWQRAVFAMQTLPPILHLRLGALLFGVWDQTQQGLSFLLSDLHTLCFSSQTKKALSALLLGLLAPIELSYPALKRRLQTWGPTRTKEQILLSRALLMQPAPNLTRAHTMVEDVLQKNECYQISQLAVTGGDLLALGLSGKQIGRALNQLCAAVIDEACPNTKTTLLAYCAQALENGAFA